MTTTNNASPGAAGERRNITVLFADLVSSTELAESMDPEDWTSVVKAAIGPMSDVVERYEGTVTQFAGDAIMAVFGAPRAHEDDPHRAALAGIEMIERVGEVSRTLQPELGFGVEIRVGIHTGLAVVGDIDAGALSEYTALGDTANVASRVQGAARPGAVLVTGDTRRLLGDSFEVQQMGPLQLKGRSRPVEAYEITGVEAGAVRSRGIPGLHSPMVGRDGELAELGGLLAVAQAGRGRVVLITGDPGIGKSRLLREFHSSLPEGSRWVVGRCLSFGRRFPYHLVASLVRALVGTTEGDAAERVKVAVAEHTSGPGPGGDRMAEHLVHLLGLAEPGHALDDAPPEELQRGYLEAVAGLVTRVASEAAPVVMVCEDIHWADASSARLLSDLLPRCHDQPVLLALTARPERTGPGWQVVTDARQELGDALTEISLTGLDDDDARELVSHLLAIESIPHDLRRLVLDKAEGNPFFVEEVIRMLIERGAISRSGDRWIADSEVPVIEVPDTVQGLLLARIDGLPEEARSAARAAAVIGRQFPVDLLRHVDPSSRQDGGIHPQLGMLEAHGLIKLAATRPELEYAFRHALVHEVVYGSILKRERRRLHRVVGEAIETLYPDRSDELAPILARHFAEAGDHERAARYSLVAGRKALIRFAVQEAYELFTQAAEHAGDRDDVESARIRLESALGRSRAGRTFVPYDVEIGVLDAAAGDADTVGDASLAARLHLAIVEARGMAGEWYETSDAYRDSLDRAFALSRAADDPAVGAAAKAMMAGVRSRAGDYEAAISLYRESVPALAGIGHTAEASIYAGDAAVDMATIGRFEEADEWGRMAVDLAEESGDPNARLDADLAMGRIQSERGDLIAAMEFTRRAIELADDTGNLLCSLVGNFLVGDQLIRLGRAHDAIRSLDRGDQLAAYCQAGSFMALGQAWRATARAQQGEWLPEAYESALATARTGGNRLGEAEVLRQRGVARVLTRSDVEEAVADIGSAIERFESLGARPYLARALRDLAGALDLAGRPAEAAASLQRADRLFVEMGLEPEPAR